MRRPLEESYWTTVAVVVCALAPDIVATAAHFLLVPAQLADLHTSRTTIELGEGLSNAGYAFGALLAGDLIQRFRQRRLFLGLAPAFVAGCLVTATSGDGLQLLAGRTLMGISTGLLLVVAVPPLVQRFPASRMPFTAGVIDIGFFGAVAAGPVVGGIVADVHGWRWLYVVLAAFGAVAFVLGLLSLPDADPPNPDLGFDRTAVGLGLLATVLPFVAVAKLQAKSWSFASLGFVLPLALGAAAFVTLLVVQYRKEEPLAPVKPLSAPVPVFGTLAAMVGGGAFVAFVALLSQFLTGVDERGAMHVAVDFLPQLGGVLIASFAVGALVRTRYLFHLTVAGMVALCAGGALLVTLHGGHSHVRTLAVTGLLGLGAGASVSPGLWLAALSLPAKIIGRTFALVELVRSVFDFVIGPATTKIAAVNGIPPHSVPHGIRVALNATLGFAVVGTLGMLAVWFGGGARPHTPQLEQWLDGDEPAIPSSG
jgi:MFS family permease